MLSGLLVLLELIEGTDPLFSLLVFTFLMLSVLAFNVARGFSRPSGAYIFFFSVLTVDVGVVYKALLGQAAQTNLPAPLLLIGVYTVTMAGMLAAAFLSSKISTSRDGVSALLHLQRVDFGSSALGSFLLYWAIYFAAVSLSGIGPLISALNQINQFLPLSIMLGTIAVAQSSGGRRSTSALTWIAMAVVFVQFGLFSFSKQGMFTPITCWLIGVSWTRFRFRPYQIAVIACFAYFAQAVLVPMANIGRNEVITGTMAEREAIVEHHFTHVHELQVRNHDQELDQPVQWYYGGPQGIFDRLTMMPPDAELIAFTAQGHYFGYLPVRYYFENWVPHIIDPHKLEGISVGGNTYAHEMGHLADEDTTTGISYSPAAEAFHIDGWRGLFLLIMPLMLLLFVVTDALCGDLRVQPWGMLPVLVFAHTAPEGGLNGAIWWAFFGNIGILFAIFFCGYVAPVLGLLLKGDARPGGWQSAGPAGLPGDSGLTVDTG